MPQKPQSPAGLSDAALIAHVEMLAGTERAAMVDLVASLAEFDARSLYLGQGCASMFTYCTQILHLSEHAAYARIGAARIVRRFPMVLELLREGAVTLTTLGLLGPHLRTENYRELLATARHKSKREVELLVAAIRPEPPVEPSIRKLPSPRIVQAFQQAAARLADPRLWETASGQTFFATSQASETAATTVFSPNDVPFMTDGATDGDARHAIVGTTGREEGDGAPPADVHYSPTEKATAYPEYNLGGQPPPESDSGVARTSADSGRPVALTRSDLPNSSIGSRPFVVGPLSEERYRIQFTASRHTYETLRRAQDLLRHTIPDGNPAEIVDRALTLLVEHLERAKFAATRRPRQSSETQSTSEQSRRIPAAVRRHVWKRDGGQCAFVGARGRCAERGFLEFHHVVPFAAGGQGTVDNIQLRCRAHNAYEARIIDTGEGVGSEYLMDRETAQSVPTSGGPMDGDGVATQADVDTHATAQLLPEQGSAHAVTEETPRTPSTKERRTPDGIVPVESQAKAVQPSARPHGPSPGAVTRDARTRASGVNARRSADGRRLLQKPGKRSRKPGRHD